jgi:thioesterase domain-containing protein
MLDYLQNYILSNIPIANALGIKVVQASRQQVKLSAPFINNINHKDTVFGGSLQAVATLACWGLLQLNLNSADHSDKQLVITCSHIDYHKAVTTDFIATACLPEQALWQRFLYILQKKHKARVTLNATIYQDNVLAVAYTGTFAALASPSSK